MQTRKAIARASLLEAIRAGDVQAADAAPPDLVAAVMRAVAQLRQTSAFLARFHPGGDDRGRLGPPRRLMPG